MKRIPVFGNCGRNAREFLQPKGLAESQPLEKTTIKFVAYYFRPPGRCISLKTFIFIKFV